MQLLSAKFRAKKFLRTQKRGDPKDLPSVVGSSFLQWTVGDVSHRVDSAFMKGALAKSYGAN